jgi:hypothetical protein
VQRQFAYVLMGLAAIGVVLATIGLWVLLGTHPHRRWFELARPAAVANELAGAVRANPPVGQYPPDQAGWSSGVQVARS